MFAHKVDNVLILHYVKHTIAAKRNKVVVRAHFCNGDVRACTDELLEAVIPKTTSNSQDAEHTSAQDKPPGFLNALLFFLICRFVVVCQAFGLALVGQDSASIPNVRDVQKAPT